MEGLADFLDALLGGVDLIFFALAVGSLLWGLLILRPWRGEAFAESLTKTCVSMLYKSAFTLAGIQLTTLFVKSWLIAERQPVRSLCTFIFICFQNIN